MKNQFIEIHNCPQLFSLHAGAMIDNIHDFKNRFAYKSSFLCCNINKTCIKSQVQDKQINPFLMSTLTSRTL